MTSWANPSRTLVIDLETHSSADLARTGSAKYAEAEDFEILLMSYAWDDDPVEVWDFTSQGTPPWLRGVLLDPDVLKVAWNMSFERNCLNAALGIYTEPEQWRDAMTLAAMNGLPLSLDAAGAALQLTEQKLETGKALIRYFCQPCRPTITNGGRTRNLPEHAPEKWEKFVEYCKRDTEVERTIYQRLLHFPVPAWERRVEALDARINDRGVLVDLALAEAAVALDEAVKARHSEELQRLTGLENPNSVAQLKVWLEAAGVTCESLNKAAVSDLLKTDLDPTIRQVLKLRQQLGKTSTKKYQAVLDGACKDHRVRGLLQYYGASRTGRWAGRRLQLQNLAQNHLDEIGSVRELVRQRDLETLEMCYDSIPDVLSQLIRTTLVAKPGHTFLVADYSAIEARVVNYLAGETWANEAFAAGEDIYCKTASMTFGVPVVKHGINGHLRQRGKVMVLGLGYGMGVSKFIDYSAGYGVHFDQGEAEHIVSQWRQTSPSIPRLWRNIEKAAKDALRFPGKTYTVSCGPDVPGDPGWKYEKCSIKFRRNTDALICTLPSGRSLSYWGARLEDGGIVYMSQNQTTRKWEKTKTWGGKLTENLVQSYARDCLAVAMIQMADEGYNIEFSVHDEVICEEPLGGRTWEDMAEVMGRPIEWAPGLLLRGDGYETPFYMKD